MEAPGVFPGTLYLKNDAVELVRVAPIYCGLQAVLTAGVRDADL